MPTATGRTVTSEAAQRVDITINIDYHDTGEHFSLSVSTATHDRVRHVGKYLGFAVAKVRRRREVWPGLLRQPRWIITAVKQYTHEISEKT